MVPMRARWRFTALSRPLSDEIAGDEIAAAGDLLRDLWSCVNAREIDGVARVLDSAGLTWTWGRVMFFFGPGYCTYTVWIIQG